jgi:hypothetical protein
VMGNCKRRIYVFVDILLPVSLEIVRISLP